MKQGRDVNALAFDPDDTRDPRSKHFIPRDGSRNRGLEISFDPDQHKEWVTGFRKRKNERKTAGMKQLEAKAKQELIESRLEEQESQEGCMQRKRKRKEELHLPDDYGIHDSDLDEPEAKPVVTEQAVFSTPGVTTTVTTAALAFDPENDASAGDSHDCNEGSDAEHVDVARGAQGPATSCSFPSEGNGVEGEVEEGPVLKAPSAYKQPSAANKEEVQARKKKKPGSAGNRLAMLKEKKSGKKTLQPVQSSKKSKREGKGKKNRVSKKR